MNREDETDEQVISEGRTVIKDRLPGLLLKIPDSFISDNNNIIAMRKNAKGNEDLFNINIINNSNKRNKKGCRSKSRRRRRNGNGNEAPNRSMQTGQSDKSSVIRVNSPHIVSNERKNNDLELLFLISNNFIEFDAYNNRCPDSNDFNEDSMIFQYCSD